MSSFTVLIPTAIVGSMVRLQYLGAVYTTVIYDRNFSRAYGYGRAFGYGSYCYGRVR